MHREENDKVDILFSLFHLEGDGKEARREVVFARVGASAREFPTRRGERTGAYERRDALSYSRIAD